MSWEKKVNRPNIQLISLNNCTKIFSIFCPSPIRSLYRTPGHVWCVYIDVSITRKIRKNLLTLYSILSMSINMLQVCSFGTSHFSKCLHEHFLVQILLLYPWISDINWRIFDTIEFFSSCHNQLVHQQHLSNLQISHASPYGLATCILKPRGKNEPSPGAPSSSPMLINKMLFWAKTKYSQISGSS